MLQQQIRGRWTRRGIALTIVGGGIALLAGNAISQQPLPKLQPVPVSATAPAPVAPAKPVALLHNNSVAVSHDDFGKFLMDRGGAEKLESFINIKIIDLEAAKRGLTVTKTELEAALNEDLSGLGEGGAPMSRSNFVNVMLAKNGTTLYAWMEDVVRPRLLLTKMCRDRIKLNENDLKLQFERRFGEMREVQMIIWPKGDDLKMIQQAYARIRNNNTEYDGEARKQANPGLAASCGKIKPITKHLMGDDKRIEEVAFQLKPGDVSEIIHTEQGYIVMKLTGVIPANAKVNFEKERPLLEKAAFEARLGEEIPKCFAELKKAAAPQLHYVGPTDWKPTGNFLDSVQDVIRGAGATNQIVPTPGAGR